MIRGSGKTIAGESVAEEPLRMPRGNRRRLAKNHDVASEARRRGSPTGKVTRMAFSETELSEWRQLFYRIR